MWWVECGLGVSWDLRGGGWGAVVVARVASRRLAQDKGGNLRGRGGSPGRESDGWLLCWLHVEVGEWFAWARTGRGRFSTPG